MSSLSEMPERTSKLSQTIRHSAVVGAVSAICVASVLGLVNHYRPAQYALALSIVKLLCAFEWFPIIAKTTPKFAGNPIVIGLLLGFYGGATRYWIKDFVFPALDKEVLNPVPVPQAFDPLRGPGFDWLLGNARTTTLPLPWIAPGANAVRHSAWTQLRDFSRTGAVNGRLTLWLRPRKAFRAFDYAFLVGKSGSGKSRMALEFLRRDLAQCKDSEVGGEFHFGEWLRRVTPGLRRLPNDPWDIGWIKPNRNGKEISSFVLHKLGEWKPRRPTALLLDDPQPGDASEIVRILAAQSESDDFRYPVRLLIVNQTLPGDMNWTFDRNGWSSRLSADDPRVIVLDAESSFDRSDLYLLTGWDTKNPSSDKDTEKLWEITEGNPLLVEIALHLMKTSHISISHLDAQSLLAERASRIVAALKAANPILAASNPALFHAGLRAIASGTIAGGEVMGIRPNEMKATVRAMRETLDACFNLDSRTQVPCVRPERVGDAFVELILEKYCGAADTSVEDSVEHIALQDQIVIVSWSLNSTGVLLTIRRKASALSDFGRILRLAPSESLMIDKQAIALAYSAASFRSSIDQPWPSGWPLPVACLHIGKLEPSEAKSILPILFTELRTENIGVKTYGMAGAICFLTALHRSLPDLTSNRNELEAIADAVIAVAEYWEDTSSGHQFLTLVNTQSSEEKHALDALRHYAVSVTESMDSSHEAHSLLKARLWKCVCFASSTRWQNDVDSIAACNTAADEVFKACLNLSNQRATALFKLDALRSKCRVKASIPGHATETGLQELAQQAFEIADQFSGDADVTLLRVQVLNCLCCSAANKGDSATCNATSSTALKAIHEFLPRTEFELEAILIWGQVCRCSVAWPVRDSFECARASVMIFEIASRHPKERRFQLAAMRCLRDQCFLYAYTDQPQLAKCEQAISTLRSIGRELSWLSVPELASMDATRYLTFARERLGMK